MAATVGNLRVELSVGVRKALEGMRRFNSSLEQTKQSMETVAASAGKVALAFGAATAAIAVDTAKFQKNLTKTAAIAAGSASNFDGAFAMMEKSALELASTTVFTTDEVVSGMEALAMAGLGVTKTIAAMPQVLRLSSAAAVDLGTSADIVTNVMAGFNLQADKLAEANNVLVATFTGSNTSLEALGEAFKIAGPVANTFGRDMSEISAALGILANAGFRGTDAGTGLKRALTSLVKATPATAKALGNLGLRASDAANSSFPQIIDQLEKAQAKFKAAGKETEFTSNLFKAFGEIAGPKVAALIAQGADAVADLQARIEVAKKEDLAAFIEQKQLQTFAGQFALLRSAVDGLAKSIGKQLLPILAPMVKWIKQAVDRLNQLSPSVKKAIAATLVFVTAVSGIVAVLAAVGVAVAGGILAFSALASVIPAVVSVVVGGIALMLAAANVFLAAWDGTWKDAKSSFMEFGTTLKVIAKTIAVTAVQALLSLGKGLQIVINFIVEALLFIATMPLRAIAGAVDLVTAGLVKALQFITSKIDDAMVIIKKAIEAFPNVAEALGLDPKKIDDFSKSAKRSLKGLTAGLKAGLDLGGESGKLDDFVKLFTESFKFDTNFDPAKVAEKFVEDMPGALSDAIKDGAKMGASTLGEILKEAFGDGGAAAVKKIEDMLKKGAKFNPLNRAVTVGSGTKSEEQLKQERSARNRLIEIINQQTAKAKNLLSAFPSIQSSLNEFSDILREIEKNRKKGGDRLANEATKKLRRATELQISAQLSEIKNAKEFAKAMEFAEKASKDLGLSFDNISKRVKKPDFFDVERVQGVSLQGAIGNQINNLIGGLFSDLGRSATASDALSDGLIGLFSGDLALGQTLGTAIGAAFGSPQIGAAIGSGLENLINSFSDKVSNLLSSLSEAIPEQRLSGAFGSAADAVKPFITAIGFLSLFLFGVAGPLVAAAIAVTTFAGAIVGITAFFANLVTQTESFAKIGDAFKTIADNLIPVLDPLIQPFISLAAILDMFIPILTAFLPSVEGATAAAKLVFEIFKFGAMVLGGFFFAVGSVQNALIDLAQSGFGEGLINAIFNPIEALGNAIKTGASFILDVFETISFLLPAEAAAQLAASRSVVDALDPSAIGNATRDFVGELDGLRANTGQIASTIADIANLSFEEALVLAEGLAEMQKAQEGMTASLTNAPTGFKVALERFRAIQTGGAFNNDPFGQGENGTPPVVNNVGTILIQVQTEDEAASILEVIEQGNFDMAAAGSGKQFNPGFG
jgi:TP901 family phage tail tape measure protein